MKFEELHKIIHRGEKAAFCLGTTAGQLSGLLNMIKDQHMTQEEIYKEICDIWKQLGMQIHEIYHKDLEKMTNPKTVNEVHIQIQNLIDIQCSNGNYDYNEYMWGLANGLILALSCITGEPPKYMDKPEKWLDDLPKLAQGWNQTNASPFDESRTPTS